MPQSPARRADLPLILIAAVVQGGSLYALHRAIEDNQWPATHLAWLVALYAVAYLVPTTVQLMVEFTGRRSQWVLTALLAGAIFYFGWHFGAIADGDARTFALDGEEFPLAAVLLVWWLLTLPFLQSRVASGVWRVDYARLFAFAWRNAITLAEAALFTGIFWLILSLWESLFHMLGIDFFQTLFDSPIFDYPVTAMVFGCALHLIGSIDTLISAVLQQLLNVLKWLGTVAAALLILFTAALLTKLPGLVSSGQHAIGAEWLLWLVAVIVLFLNAAYRDGTADRPYPRWIAQALRFAVPLTIVIAATALYALIVRSGRYGLTVERVWAFIVAGAALVYSAGYSIAALRRGPWLAMASRVNVTAALALIVVIAGALTPLLSPYRLAALSQYGLILDGRYHAPAKSQYGESPFSYLASETGNYGRKELGRLVAVQGRPDADQIRALAAKALQQSGPLQARVALAPPAISSADMGKLPLYPAGHPLDAQLSQLLVRDWNSYDRFAGAASIAQAAAGVFVDLDGDGSDEFVLLVMGGGRLYQNRGGHWQYVGVLRSDGRVPSWNVLMKAISAGEVTPVPHAWKDLLVGDHRYRVVPEHY